MESAREQGRGDDGVRAAFWLSWSLAGLSVAIFVATFPLFVLARSAQVPNGWDVDLSVGTFVGEVPFLVFPLVGALIASRRPRDAIGWIHLADDPLWMLSGVMDYYTVYGVGDGPGWSEMELSTVVRETVRQAHAFLWVRRWDVTRTHKDSRP